MLDFVRQRTRSEHQRVAALLSAYIDGALTVRQQQQVEAHLAHCQACTQDLRTLRYTKAMLTQAPAPRIPRAFVVRRADLEEKEVKEAAPRRASWLGSRLVYGYLRAATAVVTIAFVLLLAGDVTRQLGLGARQPEPAAVGVEQEAAVESTEALRIQQERSPSIVEREVTVEVEKVVEPVQQTLPPAEPAALEKEQGDASPVVGLEAAPTEAAAVEAPLPSDTKEGYGTGAPATPTPRPTVGPPSPTALPATPSPLPSAAPEPTATELAVEREARFRPTAVQVIEVGLGALALILLVITLVARRQQI